MTASLSRVCRSVAATEALGAAIASASPAPLVVALEGPVGAGKTALCRGLVGAIDPRFATWVSSPTYAIVQSYPSRPEVHHVDLYRLEGGADLDSVGYWELGPGWRLVEWASRSDEVMATADLVVTLTRASRSRTAELLPRSSAGEAVVQAVAEKLASM